MARLWYIRAALLIEVSPGFMVVDNRETGLPDQTSRMNRLPYPIASAQGWCAYRPAMDLFQVNLFEVENGNIQVH